MKYLSNYTEDAQTKLFDDNGAFFAFGDAQFKEKQIEGVKYCQLSSGLICPAENAKALVDGLGKAQEAGIAQDVKENGIDAIIRRELFNFECFYTYDISDAVDALEQYGITKDQVQTAFYKIAPTVEA